MIKKILWIILIIFVFILLLTMGTYWTLLLAQKINPVSLNIMHYYKYDLKIKLGDWDDETESFQTDKKNNLQIIKYKSFKKTLKHNKFHIIDELTEEEFEKIIKGDKTISNDLETKKKIRDFFEKSTHYVYKEKGESKILVLYDENTNEMLIFEINY